MLNILFLWCMFQMGCTSRDNILSFYENNKKEMESIKIVGNELYDKYSFIEANLRGHSQDIGMKFSVVLERPDKSTGEYYDFLTLNPILYDSSSIRCPKCDENEEQQLNLLFADPLLLSLLSQFKNLKPKAIRITEEGIFFALGPAVRHKNKSEMEAGILLPFKNRINELMVVEKINDSAFIYEGLIH